jgi:hypothetical protein
MANDKGCAAVVEKARAQVDQLMADFLADPGGEAAQMARTLLLGGMVKEQTREEESVLCELQEHKVARTVLEEDLGTLAVGRLNDHTRNRRLVGEPRHARRQNDEVAACLLQVRKALAEKKPFDYDRALNQIAAVIGLRGGEEFLVRSRVEGTPDYNLTAEEHADFHEGRGPAWEEEQRRIRERDHKHSRDL